MRIEVLAEFVSLAKTLNYRAAAAALDISQPTLSRDIDSLERALGYRLFVRDTRSVALTQMGEAALAAASETVDAYERLMHLGGTYRSGTFSCVLSIQHSILNRLYLEALDHVRPLWPGIDFRVRDSGLRMDAADLLDEGYDLALSSATVFSHPGLVSRELCQVDLSVWVNKTNRLAGRGSITLPELAGMCYRPATTRDDPWAVFCSDVLRENVPEYSTGRILDDQFQLDTNDFLLIPGEEPNSTFGFGMVNLRIESAPSLEMTAWYREDGSSPVLDDFLDALSAAGQKLTASEHPGR